MLQQAGRVWVGSPPRMRGKEMPDAPADEIAGITPAHAGKGWRSSVRPKGDGITPAHAGKRDDALIDGLIHEDHPRMCGEKRTV